MHSELFFILTSLLTKLDQFYYNIQTSDSIILVLFDDVLRWCGFFDRAILYAKFRIAYIQSFILTACVSLLFITHFCIVIVKRNADEKRVSIVSAVIKFRMLAAFCYFFF